MCLGTRWFFQPSASGWTYESTPGTSTHWFRADWLGLISTLPPLGCLALLDERDPDSPNPWYYCTALSGSNTQFEHSWSDLLRLAHSGRLMLHSRDHYHPVTPPPLPHPGNPSMWCSAPAATRTHSPAGPGHPMSHHTARPSTGTPLYIHSCTSGGCPTRPQPVGTLSGGTGGSSP